MATNKLDNELRTVVQRTGTNTGAMRTERERASFAANTRRDFAEIVYQLNVVYNPLVAALASEANLDALDKGLSGNVIFSDIDATAASAAAYWSGDLQRARTVKETFDVILTELASLENSIDQAAETSEYDDTEVRSLITTNSLDLQQLAADTMGSEYTLDGDGQADLTYSLSQAIDAIGALFAGFPGTGNTYVSTYPDLSFSVNLSDINIDTTLDPSVIFGLVNTLTDTRAFIGKDTTGPEMPNFTPYGGVLSVIANGLSLEENIWRLDQCCGGHAADHVFGGSKEIDGDTVAIDFTPVTYSPSTAPAEASHPKHLTAHLAGIDAYLTVLATGNTLQQAFDAGGVGTAGEIQINATGGHMKFKDDTGAPVGTMVEWVDGSSAAVGKLTSAGLSLENGALVRMAVRGADPTNEASIGKVNLRPDPVSSDVELFYASSNASSGNLQVTRDGRVKEVEVGSHSLEAGSFLKLAADAGPAVSTEEVTSGGTMVWKANFFDSAAAETGYASVPIPVDEDGSSPSKLRIVLTFVPKTAGAGSGARFGLSVRDDGGGNQTAGDGDAINGGWTSISDFTLSSLAANEIKVYDSGAITLSSNSSGVLPLRLTRNVSHGDDDWSDDVGLINTQVTWLR